MFVVSIDNNFNDTDYYSNSFYNLPASPYKTLLSFRRNRIYIRNIILNVSHMNVLQQLQMQHAGGL